MIIQEEVFIEAPDIEQENYETERNKPMPNIIHGIIQSNLTFAMRLKYDDQFAFPTEVSLDTTPGSTPDVCIYPKKKWRLKGVPAKQKEMPITTIEIQSPSHAPEEMIDKIWELYFSAGVKSAWLVIPSSKTIRVILPDDRDFLYTSGELHDPVTDIRIPVEKVFENIDL